MPEAYVIARRRAGGDYPVAFPTGSRVLDFHHADSGVTALLHSFEDRVTAEHFISSTVEGQVYANEAEARHAFEKLVEALAS